MESFIKIKFALHAILANNAGADFLATRNIRHYENCE
jgi:hypothetical protein